MQNESMVERDNRRFLAKTNLIINRVYVSALRGVFNHRKKYRDQLWLAVIQMCILEWTTSLDSSSGTLICPSVPVTSDVIITYHCSGCVFVDLEKAYDKVPREEVWYCMRKAGLAEKYVRIVQDMYDDSTTAVRCAVGVTEGFEVKVGLHQGSALSPCLFAMMMDRMTDEIREEAPWTMMFADDIVICSESKEQVEEKLESWRYALERRGMKVNRRKTEYMCVNERQDNSSDTVKMQGEEVAKVEDFKYLGSTVQSNGECGREVKKRVQAGWNGWRRMSGVICDRRVPARVKGKVYKVAVRPAEMEVAELKMLRFSLGVTRMDKIRNEYIRGTAQVGKFGEKTREARLRWYGHLRRKDDGYIVRWMLRMELPGKRKRGRPKRRFMDVVKEDMAEVEVTEEDTVDMRNWKKENPLWRPLMGKAERRRRRRSYGG